MTGIGVIVLAGSVCGVLDLISASALFRLKGGTFERLLQFIARYIPQSAPRTICFYDFATKQTREIFKTERDTSDGISVAPDGRYMLYSQLDENSSNIMLVSNFH